MLSSRGGSFRLFRVAGIDVFLHWSWLVVAFLQLHFGTNLFRSQVWNVASYLTLFGIVLLHEFGHALACRSVGGAANRIVLWPLGGVAYVNPPPRAGAVLWSITAGPLVNLVLVPVTVVALFLACRFGAGSWELVGGDLTPFMVSASDLGRFASWVAVMNLGLLLFNLAPIYPLDGGQILQALLWYAIGRWRSLQIVSVIGMILGVLVGALALALGEGGGGLWLALIAGFVALRSWAGFRQAHLLLQLASRPKHLDAACPTCQASPPAGRYWVCDHCRTRFDTFETRAACPACGAWFRTTACPYCSRAHPVSEWFDHNSKPDVQPPSDEAAWEEP